jgi:hypothetical protein
MITTCLTLAGMIAFVLFPLFIPITVHAVDAVLSRRTSALAGTAGYSRLTAPRRLSVAAA